MYTRIRIHLVKGFRPTHPLQPSASLIAGTPRGCKHSVRSLSRIRPNDYDKERYYVHSPSYPLKVLTGFVPQLAAKPPVHTQCDGGKGVLD